MRRSRWPARRPFNEARTFVRSLGLKNQKEWISYAQSANKPADIPSNPQVAYKGEWRGLADWVGTNNISNRAKQFLPFAEAREIARSLGLSSAKAWYEYSASGNRLESLPVAPDVHYGDQFAGWGDWLGTGRIATQEIEFLPFYEARAYVHTLQLRSVKAWDTFCQSEEKPPDIPASPRVAYPDAFVDWYDWLGKKKRVKRKAFIYDALHIGVLREIE